MSKSVIEERWCVKWMWAMWMARAALQVVVVVAEILGKMAGRR